MSVTVMARRMKFPKGKQGLFLRECQHCLKLDNRNLANLLGVSVRTLTDWKAERFLIPERTALFLSRKCRLSLQHNIKFRDEYWYTKIGGRIGGEAVYKKYGYIGGDQVKRKKSWLAWWNKKGKFSRAALVTKPKSIKIVRNNTLLSEFVGIMMGDGGISSHQVVITLNKKDDWRYGLFVRKLIKKLFGISPAIYINKNDNAMDIVVSRINLVRFCQKMGLKVGNKIKQKLDIPDWIKSNTALTKNCLRGLIDTDGSVVIHQYTVNNKRYCYKKINFSSASKFLIKSVHQFLTGLGFRPRISHNGRNVWLDSKKDAKMYFEIIGTHNPKHRDRYLR